MNGTSNFDAIFLIAAVRLAINQDVFGPICEQVDAGNDHLSEAVLRGISTENVAPRDGAARCGRGQDGTDSRTVGQIWSFARSANNV